MKSRIRSFARSAAAARLSCICGYTCICECTTNGLRAGAKERFQCNMDPFRDVASILNNVGAAYGISGYRLSAFAAIFSTDPELGSYANTSKGMAFGATCLNVFAGVVDV